MSLRRKAWAVLVVIGLVVLHWLVFQPRETAPGVVTRPLGLCEIDWHTRRQVLVLACPRQDLIRLWPLPITSPWFEDPMDDTVIAGQQMRMKNALLLRPAARVIGGIETSISRFVSIYVQILP